MKTKRVMGFGTFDAVHPGHLFYLKQLKALGDELFVVIARDHNVERTKGNPTHFKENLRKKHVESMGIADHVILGHESNYHKVILDYKPNVLGFGYDQRVDLKKLQAEFPKIEMVRINAFEPDRYKSSIIKSQFKS